MKTFIQLLKQKPKLDPDTFIYPPSVLNYQDYVARCLKQELTEKPETRTYDSHKILSHYLSLLNQGMFLQVIAGRPSITRFYTDFDLVYKWLGSAYRQTNQLSEAHSVLMEGLALSNRKVLLLKDMGETESELGNLGNAVYWWSQALHCLETNPIDYNPYLLLSYVAKGIGDTDVEKKLLDKVDSLEPGKIRLGSKTAHQLTELAREKKNNAIVQVLRLLESKYV